MEGKTLSYPIFEQFHLAYAKSKSLSLHFPHLKKLLSLPETNNFSNLAQTITFQAKLPSYCFSKSMVKRLSKMLNQHC